MERLLRLCQAVASAPPNRHLAFTWAPHTAAFDDLFALPGEWGVTVSVPNPQRTQGLISSLAVSAP